MPQRTFSYAGLDIGVETDAVSHLDWLAEFLAPAFLCSTRAAHQRIDLIIDPARYQRCLAAGPSGAQPVAFVLDTGPRRLPAWSADAGDLCLHDPDMQVFYAVAEQRTLVLAADWRARLRSALMRPLRELAMDAAQRRGALLLHAAAFAVDGRAAIIAGAKEAGKTSLLTYLLSAAGADYLTNDRLLLEHIDGRLWRGACRRWRRSALAPWICFRNSGSALPSRAGACTRRSRSARVPMHDRLGAGPTAGSG
jgi:hypothetical protein